MDEVVGDGDAFERAPARLGVERVADDDLDPLSPGPSLEAGRITDEYPDMVALIEEAGDEPAADIAGRTGDENEPLAR